MKYSIKQIAQEAGVSIATVSKVLNNKMYVSDQTREKVMNIIEKHHYSPSPSAVNLVKQTAKTIFYADSFTKGLPYKNPHMFDIICGVSDELSRKGYQLSLLNLSQKDKTPEQIITNCIMSRAASGIIVNEMHIQPPLEKFILAQEFPLLCIGSPDSPSLLSWIDINHSLSSNLAVEHLLNTGCQRIAYMGGQKNDHIFEWRLQGFLNAAQANHLDVPNEYIIYNSPDIHSITENAKKLVSLPLAPDAIICTNGLMLVGTVQAIQKEGKKIPDDISVIGFDDYPFSPMTEPSPTVIDIDLYSLGINAAGAIIKKIKSPTMLIQTYTALPNLIQRNTTRPL